MLQWNKYLQGIALESVDIQKIHYMVIAKCMDQQLSTFAMMAIRCMESIAYANAYPMDTGLVMHHNAER